MYGLQTDSLELALSDVNYQIYGALYNFKALEDWSLCPSGWHIPSEIEWLEMARSLGASNVVGLSLKRTFGGWAGSDLSGFGGLPGGRRNFSKGYVHMSTKGYWWSMPQNGGQQCSFLLTMDSQGFSQPTEDKRLGISVRCVRTD